MPDGDIRTEVKRNKIGVYDGSLAFSLAVMDVKVSPSARMIRHPVESGGTVFDNKLLDPITLEVEAIVDYDDTEAINAIYKMWRNRSFKFYTIQTWDGEYRKMSLVSCPHPETPDTMGSLSYHLVFQEAMLVGNASDKGKADKANESFQRSGRLGGSLGW